MAKQLQGKKIAILVENGFEQVEMTEPRRELAKAGAKTFLVSPQKKKVKAWKKTEWGEEFPVAVQLGKADSLDFDALLIPGGVMSPDKLRMNEEAVEFVTDFFDEEKPVAAICHGPWLLAEADVLDGRIVTSWPSLRTDLENAGAEWVDEQVVVDNGIITARKPDDIPVFSEKMIEEFANDTFIVEYLT